MLGRSTVRLGTPQLTLLPLNIIYVNENVLEVDMNSFTLKQIESHPHAKYAQTNNLSRGKTNELRFKSGSESSLQANTTELVLKLLVFARNQS